MSLHKVTEYYTEWFSVCTNVTSKYCNIAIFKSEINIVIKLLGISMIYCTRVICLSTTVRGLSP
jgi:hypothetical protein